MGGGPCRSGGELQKEFVRARHMTYCQNAVRGDILTTSREARNNTIFGEAGNSLAAHPEKRRYSFEQYMMLLQNNEQRLEYDHGDIYAMAGSSANHAAISAKTMGLEKPCIIRLAYPTKLFNRACTILGSTSITHFIHICYHKLLHSRGPMHVIFFNG